MTNGIGNLPTAATTPQIPTARAAAGSYTRKALDDALDNSWQDEPNRVPMYDDAWGRPSAWAAFGEPA